MRVEKLACPSCGAPLSGDFVPNQQIECNSCGVPLLLTHLDADNPIFCPQCRTLNANEIRYCVTCGHQLKIDCPLCHTANRIDAVFCARCGVHLARLRRKRELLSEATHLLRQERLEILREKDARQRQEKLHRLVDALDEPENHPLAIHQLNQLGREAIEILTETLLNDADPDARYGSARALGQIVAEKEIKVLVKSRTVKALIEALGDREAAVRYWAAEALGKCQSQRAVKPLAALLKDQHEGVREQARRSLQKIGGAQAEAFLKQAQSKGFLNWLKGN
jgi:phage FluMu protein Com